MSDELERVSFRPTDAIRVKAGDRLVRLSDAQRILRDEQDRMRALFNKAVADGEIRATFLNPDRTAGSRQERLRALFRSVLVAVASCGECGVCQLRAEEVLDIERTGLADREGS